MPATGAGQMGQRGPCVCSASKQRVQSMCISHRSACQCAVTAEHQARLISK